MRRHSGTSNTGYPVEAIRHAQAAGEWTHAIRVLADNCVDLVFDGRKATLRALLAAFPAGAAEADAELALACATARLYDGLLEEAGTNIAVAERLAATVADDRQRLFELRLASAVAAAVSSAAISPPQGRRCGPSKRRPPPSSRSATIAPRR